MGTGSKILMLGVLTGEIFAFLFPGKSSLGTRGPSTSHLFGMAENRSIRMGSVFHIPLLIQIFNKLT